MIYTVSRREHNYVDSLDYVLCGLVVLLLVMFCFWLTARVLFLDYSCSYWKSSLPRQGWLYLSVNHLCFYSYFMGAETVIILRWTSIKVSLCVHTIHYYGLGTVCYYSPMRALGQPTISLSLQSIGKIGQASFKMSCDFLKWLASCCLVHYLCVP